MEKLGRKIVKFRIPIFIISILLLIPATIGYINTRVNYDILYYLPDDIETMKGQDILVDEFGTGAYSMFLCEGMENKDVAALKQKIEDVEHVEKVVWYDSFADISIPMEMLPEKIRTAFNSEDSTMMFIIFDTTTSADETMDAIEDIRHIAGKQCFLSGMSAVVTDTKNLAESEVAIYVVIAVALSCIVLALTMETYLIPVLFLLSIGMAILYNMGTNVLTGEISYITKALSAVLQLGVTMDYSIFLWHSYQEKKEVCAGDHKEAMAQAIAATIKSVVGSSITTIAGFVALCFMSFTLGLDLGIVMTKGVIFGVQAIAATIKSVVGSSITTIAGFVALCFMSFTLGLDLGIVMTKGVIFGVICCVTVLPSMIMIFDKALEKTAHRQLIPDFPKVSDFVVKHHMIFAVAFLLLFVPFAYFQANTSVYYNLDATLPKDLESIQANTKLQEEYDMGAAHMILLDKNVDDKQKYQMISEMEKVDGVKQVLGLEAVVGPTMPKYMIPKDILEVLESDNYELMLVMNEYPVASDQVNQQIDKLNKVLKQYDPVRSQRNAGGRSTVYKRFD